MSEKVMDIIASYEIVLQSCDALTLYLRARLPGINGDWCLSNDFLYSWISAQTPQKSRSQTSKTKTEKNPHDTHHPRLLKWRSSRQWVQVTLLLPPQVSQKRTPTLQCLESYVCRDVMFKLLFFTFAMILLPLGTYWFTFNYVFEGLPPLLLIFWSRLQWIDVDGRV